MFPIKIIHLVVRTVVPNMRLIGYLLNGIMYISLILITQQISSHPDGHINTCFVTVKEAAHVGKPPSCLSWLDSVHSSPFYCFRMRSESQSRPSARPVPLMAQDAWTNHCRDTQTDKHISLAAAAAVGKITLIPSLYTSHWELLHNCTALSFKTDIFKTF